MISKERRDRGEEIRKEEQKGRRQKNKKKKDKFVPHFVISVRKLVYVFRMRKFSQELILWFENPKKPYFP